MNGDPKQNAGMCRLLEKAGCLAQIVGSPAELKDRLKDKTCIALIMDIDSVAVDNRSIKEIATEFPDIPLLCISKEPFHPELKDSILDSIYACLTKPIDPDELNYWVKCIREDSRNPTVG